MTSAHRVGQATRKKMGCRNRHIQLISILMTRRRDESYTCGFWASWGHSPKTIEQVGGKKYR
jgi:hypothetical protein